MHLARIGFGAALLALSGPSNAAPPIGPSGDCPSLARTNVYDGVPVEGLFSTAASGSRTWFARPPSEMTAGGEIQAPLTPQASVNCVRVPAGLKPQVIASELTPGPLPAAAYLMYFTFDEKGRMWAVDNRDYPYVHTSSTPGTYSNNRATGGNGRVLIYEDVDGDGSLDAYKVFYAGLMGPTSLEYIPGPATGGADGAGVILTVPPFVYFIPKSAADPDTAGPIQAVVTAIGSAGATYDTHFQTNSLTAGIDNFYYGHAGSNGCGSPVVGTNRGVGGCGGGAVWRFKATAIGSDTNTFQLHSIESSANAHGIGQMEDGQWFKSWATGSAHSNHQIRHNTASLNITTGTRANDYWPLTNDRWLWEGSTTTRDAINTPAPGDYYTGNTAGSGHDFYTARLLPRKYWNRFSFVCEGASKLCNQDSLTLNGSTWRMNRMHGKERSNIFASTDAWTAPLKVRTGPDGALWVLDWYNYLFLHNPLTPATMVAWNNPLRAKSRVRIYRIVPEAGNTDAVPDLSQAPVPQLLQALAHRNLHWRLMAQRILIRRHYAAGEREALLDSLHRILMTDVWVEDSALGTGPRALHALWTAEGLKLHAFKANPAHWDSALRQALLHPAWTVRRNAVLALPLTVASANALKAACAVNDPHPHVRIQALDVFARQNTGNAAQMQNDTLRAYWPMPVPSDGPAPSVRALRVDLHADSAFAKARRMGRLVDDSLSAGRPASCPAIRDGRSEPVRVAAPGSIPARRDLRFTVRPGGFTLGNSPRLGSGELVVRDLRGVSVFRSSYNAAQGRWSNPVARDLVQPIYLYSFSEVTGAKSQGRIVLAADL